MVHICKVTDKVAATIAYAKPPRNRRTKCKVDSFWMSERNHDDRQSLGAYAGQDKSNVL